MNAACVAGCGSTSYDSFGIKLHDLIAQLMQQAHRGEKFNPARIILDLMLQHNRNNLLEFKVAGKSLVEVRTDGVARFYPNLITADNFYEALCEAEVAYDGLGHFVRMHFINNPHCKVALMAHTHCPTLSLCGNGKNHAYANPGYFCPSQPDIKNFVRCRALLKSKSSTMAPARSIRRPCAAFSEDIVEVASLRVL